MSMILMGTEKIIENKMWDTKVNLKMILTMTMEELIETGLMLNQTIILVEMPVLLIKVKIKSH